uniref:Integrin alpha FG-GAP repeat containing 3 n=1 Tax=Nothobranchius rachovii TaxID=451742 RepID=A0A1A8RRF0_9TELE
MERSDHATEGDPLKRGEDGTETVTGAASASGPKKRSCKEGLGVSRLTHWRTAVFFLSLFLCLIIVFAFSFIMPCPVRAQYLVTWKKTFSESVTYEFLAFEHSNDDKVKDVLFIIKNTNGTLNQTCTEAGLPSPCVFVVAVDGTDGDTLWERPLHPEFQWAHCDQGKKTSRTWHCLMSHSGNLTAINKNTGHVIWQQPQPTVLVGSLPVLSVPDLDQDKVDDVVLVASSSTLTQLILLSGKTGAQMGSTVVLDSVQTANHLIHVTEKGFYYILLQNDTDVYGLELSGIAAKAGLKTDKVMEAKADSAVTLLPIYQSNAVSLVRTKDADDSSDLLVVSGNEVALINGKTLRLKWKFSCSSVIGKPSLGHFNKDGVLDVVVEDDVGNQTKRIIILDGKSGGVLWEVRLLAIANSPGPASIYTTKSISVFIVWGLMPSESNSTKPPTISQRSYLLHPRHSEVLLEITNVTDHILSFKATLMEHGRHAAYLLLTGPESEDTNGTVVLTKQKLKQNISKDDVRHLGTSTETNEEIVEAFQRLRFSD